MLLGVLMVLGLAPVNAGAQENPNVSVSLDKLDPTTVAASGPLTLSGTVTNTTDTAIGNVSVVLWRDKGPITNVDALKLTLDDSNDNREVPVTSDGGTAKIGLLPPRTTVQFTVYADFATGTDPLQLSSPGTVSVVGVNVLGANGDTIGSSRVLMANPSAAGYQATTVVQLSSAPSLVGTESGRAVFSDDHLSQEIAAGGRLDLLAQLAEQDDVSAVIDPLLWDELSTMAGGYSVRQADGSVKAGESSAVAGGFLSRLRTLAQNGRCYRSLYGVLDLQAAHSARRADLLTSAIDAVPSSHPLAPLPLVVLPSQGSLTRELLAFMAPAKPELVLTGNLDTNTVVASTESGEKLVAVHSAINSGGPGPEPSDDLVHRAGRLQSEQLLSSAQNTPAVNVVSSADQARAELAAASGRHRVSLRDLLTEHQATRVTLNAPVAVSPPQALITAEQTARDSEALVTAVTGTTTGLDMDAVTLRAWSASFASGDQATAYLAAATRDVTAKINGGAVSVHISSQLVVPTEATQLPISLTNSMKLTARVRVHFSSDNPQRVSIPDTEVIALDPGESATVRISPVASGNGTVAMHAIITGANGTALPLAEPVQFVVTANSAGRAGWLIIIASGVVLLGATALRVRQVRHEKARAAAARTLPGTTQDPVS